MNDKMKHINLKCNVCGNDQFSPLSEFVGDLTDAPDDIELKCSDCGTVISKVELFKANQHIIDANIDDLCKETVNDVIKTLEKSFKKWK